MARHRGCGTGTVDVRIDSTTQWLQRTEEMMSKGAAAAITAVGIGILAVVVAGRLRWHARSATRSRFR